MDNFVETSQTSQRRLKPLLLPALVLFVALLGFLIGNSLCVFRKSKEEPLCPSCQSQEISEEISTEYHKACYPLVGCGKYTLFSFEYPYGWHVRYFLTLTADGPEGGLEISPNPLAPNDCPEVVTGGDESKSKEELNETTFGEFAEEQNRKNDEMEDRNFRKENFSLQEGLSGFCYSYHYADHMCGFRDVVDCYIDFEKAGERMKFMLNDYDYFEEFKHFIESIQPLSFGFEDD